MERVWLSVYLEKDVLKWPWKEDTGKREREATKRLMTNKGVTSFSGWNWRDWKQQLSSGFFTSHSFMEEWQRSHCWKCHMTSRLQFARRHEEDSEARWKSRLWSDETEIELLAIKLIAMFGVSQLLRIVRSAPFRPWSVVMLWGSSLKSMQPNTGKEKLMQYETPATQEIIYYPGHWPNHEAEATQEVPKWPSRDLNQIENLWVDSKKAVHSQSP